jgi:hypothetical protein
LSAPITIFTSDAHDGVEAGYEIQVAKARDGSIEAVCLMDHRMNDLVELPPNVALMFAQAILAQIRDPRATLN